MLLSVTTEELSIERAQYVDTCEKGEESQGILLAVVSMLKAEIAR